MGNGHPVSVGFGACVGGEMPDPPIDAHPLLVWTGGEVKTEDGKATAEDIGLAAMEMPDLDTLAKQFGTTPDHVSQAIDYAVKAGYLEQ